MTLRERLFGLEQFGIKLGLDGIRTLLEALGDPQRAWPAVHIAGTNGKGSVAAMVERGLRAAGLRTGRYTSPHLAAIEERIAIDGRPIESARFDEVTEDVLGTVDACLASGALAATPTFFEVTTAVGFEAFRRAKVDVAVVEVGLGGRFDATNVIEPVAGAITAIDFDHERHLGHTLTAIAFEKAGIAKPGMPLVVGAVPEEAERAIVGAARERGAVVIDAARDSTIATRMEGGCAVVSLRTPVRDYPPARLSLAGRHQAGNALVAVRILEVLDHRGIRVDEDAIRTALGDTVWPARLEWLRLPRGGTLLIDAAHNPSGARALASYLVDAGAAPLPVILAVMQDKNLSPMVDALIPVASGWVATQAPSPRSRSADRLAEELRDRVTRAGAVGAGAPSVRAVSNPVQAVLETLAEHPRAAAAGSIYMVGPLREALLAGGAVLFSDC